MSGPASGNLDLLMQQANQALAIGHFQQCADLTDKVLQQVPNHPAVLVLRGMASFRLENFELAADYFDRAVVADPNSGPSHHWLSMALLQAGNTDRAVFHARRAAQLSPKDLIAQHHLAQCLYLSGKTQESWRILEPILPYSGQVFIVQHTAGLVLTALGQDEEAIRAFKRALKIDTNHIPTLVLLRERLYSQQQFVDAERIARTLTNLQPLEADHFFWLGKILMDRGVPAGAEPEIRKGLELDPCSADGCLLMGTIAQMIGDIGEAADWFARSIQTQPIQGAAYLALATNHRIGAEDADLVSEMETAVAQDRLDSIGQIQLHYSLGKAFEDLGNYAKAMHHYDRAHQISRGDEAIGGKYDRWSAQQRVERTIQAFSADQITALQSSGSTSTVPVFVVGMIRSGTTLVEQILSSHSEAAGVGEHSYWLSHAAALVSPIGKVDRTLLKPFADRYVKQLQTSYPDAKRIIDKMPTNYEVLGLIASALPHARFIHIRRNPVDTCLSIYATYNRARLSWAHEKSDLTHHYQLYQKLMEHWRSILPPDQFWEIDYEDLVENTEQRTHELISFCGLDWEDACFSPHKNIRTVATPSVWQVRQPIYRTSVARAEKFAGMLGPLNELR